MPVVRKTLAKYGAKIPPVRSTGAKLQPPSEPGAPAVGGAGAQRKAKKAGDKKR